MLSHRPNIYIAKLVSQIDHYRRLLPSRTYPLSLGVPLSLTIPPLRWAITAEGRGQCALVSPPSPSKFTTVLRSTLSLDNIVPDPRAGDGC